MTNLFSRFVRDESGAAEFARELRALLARLGVAVRAAR
jgi:Flp pilus assembly pilin Flp